LRRGASGEGRLRRQVDERLWRAGDTDVGESLRTLVLADLAETIGDRLLLPGVVAVEDLKLLTAAPVAGLTTMMRYRENDDGIVSHPVDDRQGEREENLGACRGEEMGDDSGKAWICLMARSIASRKAPPSPGSSAS
jgi:hypothetical protein